LLSQEDVTLFHDETRQAHARFPVNDHFETWPCGSEEFRDWLAALLWRREGMAAGSESLSSAMNVIRAMARFSSPKYQVHNRVAKVDGAIWYDLSDSDWRAVRITSAGWSVVKNPPVFFRRYPHQQPQVEPASPACDLGELSPFVNLRTESEGRLLLTYMVACLRPDIPHPILLLCGPQGSAKSTAFRVMRRLVDPARPDLLTFPKKQGDLVQMLSDNWMAGFDNVGSLSGETSDMLCRAATGEGFSKHKLYTDTGVILFDYRRCVGLNGIHIASYQPDLQDRCILLEFEPISAKARRSEEEFWAEFERLRPQLLAAVFDALSKAMRIYDSIKPTGLPRMADFDKWGRAIAEASGWSQDEFHAAYEQNASQRNREVLENDLVARVLEELLKDEPHWEGSPSSLLSELDNVAGSLSIDTKAKEWPRNPIALSKRLKTLNCNLAQAGIEVCRDRSSGGREISIRRRTVGEPEAAPTNHASNDRCDDRASNPSSPEAYSHVAYDGCDGCDRSLSLLGENKSKEGIVGEDAKSFVTPVIPVMPQLTACAVMESGPEGNDGTDDGCDGLGRGPSLVASAVLPQDAFATRLPLEVADWPPEYRELYEERAAMIEYDAGKSRACAEIWAELMLRRSFEREAARTKGGGSACGAN
jgi:energy-coupling factor transporter ATP-binding protein EcfA2